MTSWRRAWRTTCSTSSEISWTVGSQWTTCRETCCVCSQRRAASRRPDSWLCSGWRCGSRTPRSQAAPSLHRYFLLVSLVHSVWHYLTSLFLHLPVVVFAVDSSSSGPPHVVVHELQHPRDRRHGGDLQPDQDPTQTQSPPQPLHAVCQVRVPPVSPATQNVLQLTYSLMTHDWCCRELLNAHRDNLGTMVKLVIFNELSNARNPNNMQVLHTVLQHSPEQAPKVSWRTVQIVEWNTSDPWRWGISSGFTLLFCGCSFWRWCSRTFSPIRKTTSAPPEPYWEKSSSRPSTRSTSSPSASAWCRRERSPVTLTWSSKWADLNRVK